MDPIDGTATRILDGTDSSEIASAVGTPLVLDNATLKRLFGHYACILVDIDFSKRIFHEIIVEREGASYLVEVVYE